VFAEADMLTTSDVGMVLSQYLNSLARFKNAYTYQNSNWKWLWRTNGTKAIKVGDEEE
jgi:hypothetical protein